jgi:signal transduction histidine kinase
LVDILVCRRAVVGRRHIDQVELGTEGETVGEDRGVGMREKDSLAVDWVVWGMRWIWLACLLLFTFFNPIREDLSLAFLLLGGAVAYNLVLVLLLYFKLFPPVLSFLTSLVDALFLVAFLYASGGGTGPLILFGLFPILVTGFRYDVITSLAIAVIPVLVGGIFYFLEWYGAGQTGSPFSLAVNATVLLLAAVLSSLVSGKEREMIQTTEEKVLGDLQAARDRAKAIYEMTSTFSTTLNYYRVLDTMLDISMGLGGVTQEGAHSVGMVLLHQQEGGVSSLGVGAARNLSRRDMHCKLAGTAGAIEQALSSAEPVIVERVGNDPELGQFSSLHRCSSVICIPLRAGFEIYGLVILGSPRTGAYTAEHMEFLTAFCNQTVVALQNARLYHSLREEKEKIIDAEGEARKKLARDLHDGPTQSVAAIAMRLNYTKLLLEREPEKVKEELEKLEVLARRTTKEIRTMLFTLRPVILETQGLVVALEQYLKQLEEEAGLVVHLEAPDLGDRLDSEIEGVAFSIIEEAVTNAKKYAQARNIWVRLDFEDNLFVATVEDDGTGFDVAEVLDSYGQRGSLGLINMRERAELVEGTWDIKSAVGKGTKVTLITPLPEEEI